MCLKYIQHVINLTRYLLFLSFLIGFNAVSGQQSEFTPAEEAFIRDHRDIVFGGDPQWEPMVILSPDGSVTGFEKDLLEKINTYSGLNIQIRTGIWETLVNEAQNGEIDGLVYSSDQPERKPYFLFSKSYSHFKAGFYGRSDQKVISDIGEIAGMKIAVQASDQFAYNYVKSIKTDTVFVYETRNKVVEAILSGEVDYYFGALDFNYYLGKNSISGIRLGFLPDENGFEGLYSVRKDWPELVSILNKSIDAIGPNEILKLTNRWIFLESDDSNEMSLSDKYLIQSFKNIQLLTVQSWLPIAEVSEKGELGGWLGDYVSLLNENIGFNLHIIGTADSVVFDSIGYLKNTIWIYPDLEQKKPELYYSEPILSIPYGLAMRRGAPFYHDLRNAGEISVAVLDYNPHIEEIKIKFPNLKLEVFKGSRQEVFNEVLEGRYDAYMGSISTLNYHIQSLGYTELFIGGLVDINTTLKFASVNEELISLLNKSMRRIPEANKQRLIRDWYGGQISQMDRTLAIQILSISLIVFIVLGIWVYSLWRQIKKRKRVESHLQQNKANLLALIENSDALIYSLDQNLKIIAKNTAFETFMSHFSNKPIYSGAYISELIPEQYKSSWILRYTRALNGERFSKQDTINFLGSEHTFITRLNPIVINDEIMGVSCRTEDVTQLSKLNRYMISLMDTSYDYLFIKDESGRYVVASQSLAEVNGLSHWDEMVGKTDAEIHIDQVDSFEQDDERVLNEGMHSINKEHRFTGANGQEIWIQTTKEPIYNSDNKIVGLSGVSRNITAQKQIEQEQRMLIATIENSQDLICYLNADLHFIYINQFGMHLLGIEDYSGLKLDRILDAVTFKVVTSGLRNRVTKSKIWQEEFEVINIKTKLKITLDHHILAINDEQGEFICFVMVSRDVTERNKLQAQVLNARLNQELMNATLKAEDNERARIAHELHDGIQQKIATVSIYLQSLGEKKNHLEEVISNSISKLNETISDIRNMSNSLLPRVLKNMGLASTIQDEVQGLNKNTELAVSFHENLDGIRFSADVELNLYRIFQEATTNIIKHAQASQVIVQLILSSSLLTLIIEDDGVGFDLNQASQTGIGLSSITNRAIYLGGHIEIDSIPGEGTTILIEVKIA